MFNPLYLEIYQFTAAILGILLAALILYKVRYWKREAKFYQNELTASWKRAQWETHKNRQLPEDWSLRGVTADWEGAVRSELSQEIEESIQSLSDEMFAKLVLESVRERLEWHRDTQEWHSLSFSEYAQDHRDKVFTRLAGRIFRAVEKHRNL